MQQKPKNDKNIYRTAFTELLHLMVPGAYYRTIF